MTQLHLIRLSNGFRLCPSFARTRNSLVLIIVFNFDLQALLHQIPNIASPKFQAASYMSIPSIFFDGKTMRSGSILGQVALFSLHEIEMSACEEGAISISPRCYASYQPYDEDDHTSPIKPQRPRIFSISPLSQSRCPCSFMLSDIFSISHQARACSRTIRGDDILTKNH